MLLFKPFLNEEGKVSQKGFTLIELMIGMAVTTIVGMAGYSFFNNSLNFTVTHSKKAEMQRETRTAVDMIVREIRSAGFGILDPLSGGTHTAAAGFSTITPGNNADPDPEGVANQLDNISIGGGFQMIGTLNVSAPEGANTIVVTPLAGTDPTNPSIVGRAITLNGFFTATVGNVSGPVGGNYTLTLNTSLDRAYSKLNSVAGLQQITYTVAPFGGESALWRNDGAFNQVIASGIEDLQFGYLLADGTVVNDPTLNPSPIRGVRISLLARGADKSPTATISTRLAIEDHAAGLAPDNFHRRQITRVVEIRNLGL